MKARLLPVPPFVGQFIPLQILTCGKSVDINAVVDDHLIDIFAQAFTLTGFDPGSVAFLVLGVELQNEFFNRGHDCGITAGIARGGSYFCIIAVQQRICRAKEGFGEEIEHISLFPFQRSGCNGGLLILPLIAPECRRALRHILFARRCLFVKTVA